MRKGRFFKYLLAVLIVLGTTLNVVAQETVRFTFNSASNNYQGRVLEGDGIYKASVYPKEASASPEGFSFYRGSLFGLMGLGKYVPAKTTGRIVFEDFRYEVSQITWDRHTYEGYQGERNLKAQAFSLDGSKKYENTTFVNT